MSVWIPVSTAAVVENVLLDFNFLFHVAQQSNRNQIVDIEAVLLQKLVDKDVTFSLREFRCVEWNFLDGFSYAAMITEERLGGNINVKHADFVKLSCASLAIH